MHPRIEMFLRERDRARARGDQGVVRSTTADLRRLGVSDAATLADPSGRSAAAATATAEKPRRSSRKCEHGSHPDRCPECNPEAQAS